MRRRLLLIESADHEARALSRGLGRAGFEVTVARTGRRAIAAVADSTYDVVVLDDVLPDRDGIEVCGDVKRRARVPVMMLSAKRNTIDVVVALEIGADDYVTKPCPIPELVARIRALLRRGDVRSPGDRHLRAGSLEMDTEAFTARLRGRPLALSLTEFRLLAELARHAGRAVTREDLLKRVWQFDYLGASRLVDMAIKRLREQVEDDPSNPRLIRTVRGVGYRLDIPVAEDPSDPSLLARNLRDSAAKVADALEEFGTSENAHRLMQEIDRLRDVIQAVGDAMLTTTTSADRAPHATASGTGRRRAS